MPNNQNKIRHYRADMKMCGEMMQDLSHCLANRQGDEAIGL